MSQASHCRWSFLLTTTNPLLELQPMAGPRRKTHSQELRAKRFRTDPVEVRFEGWLNGVEVARMHVKEDQIL